MYIYIYNILVIICIYVCLFKKHGLVYNIGFTGNLDEKTL